MQTSRVASVKKLNLSELLTDRKELPCVKSGAYERLAVHKQIWLYKFRITLPSLSSLCDCVLFTMYIA